MEPNNFAVKLKDILVDTPRRYWIDEPNEIAYGAQQRAADTMGLSPREWNQTDAVKHMVWQNELARRTMLPQAVGGKLANLVGMVKEVGDQFYLRGPERLNSVMDLANNSYGANRIPLVGDNVSLAIKAAGAHRQPLGQSILAGLPYSRD